jgi:hypothetical protein
MLHASRIATTAILDACSMVLSLCVVGGAAEVAEARRTATSDQERPLDGVSKNREADGAGRRRRAMHLVWGDRGAMRHLTWPQRASNIR